MLSYLSRSGLFKGVALGTLRKSLPSFFLKKFRQNDYIYRAEEAESNIYFIMEGEVDIVRDLSGEEIRIVRLGEREFFGVENKDSGFDRTHSSSVVVSSCEAKVMCIDKRNFQLLCASCGSVEQNI